MYVSSHALPIHFIAMNILRHVCMAIHEGVEIDQDNPVDQDALQVICHGREIGYVNRAFRETLHRWLEKYRVSTTIEKLNGKPERPLVYVRISAE
ncbi:MAG: hypothetical protein ABTQ25_19975 [Nitrosomonas ureae]